ncbi:MAG: hypothetical protein HY782_08375, partial [Chloroflexi bacterium]|nr:hypothetical protein [Chloroflexota bacterium]
MQNLKPCPYRQVDDEGHILCNKIKTGDREVSPNVCRACPVAAISCAHLRATLDHQARPPITVRYGNGKTEIWEDEAPSIALARAACAAKVIPILAPRDCAGCPIRQALVTPDAIAVRPPATPAEQPAVTSAPRRAPRRTPALPPAPAPMPVAAAPMAMQPQPVDGEAEQKRSSIVAQKIIKLQEWLEKQKHVTTDRDKENADADLPLAVAARPIPRPAR